MRAPSRARNEDAAIDGVVAEFAAVSDNVAVKPERCWECVFEVRRQWAQRLLGDLAVGAARVSARRQVHEVKKAPASEARCGGPIGGPIATAQCRSTRDTKPGLMRSTRARGRLSTGMSSPNSWPPPSRLYENSWFEGLATSSACRCGASLIRAGTICRNVPAIAESTTEQWVTRSVSK
jgi:hypothetical protein